MSKLAWKLPVLRDLGPLGKGFVEAAPVLLGAALVFAGLTEIVSVRPAAETLESAAQIGATLLIAYAVETSWVIRASRHRPSRDREARLGSFTAVGAAAALGVVFSLALADRVRMGHWIWLDVLGFGWIAGSLLVLGLFVVMQPWITHEWMYENGEKRR